MIEFMEEGQIRHNWRHSLVGGGIGVVAFVILVVALRVFLRLQLDPRVSLNVLPEDFDYCWYIGPQPDTFFVYIIWLMHLTLFQSKLFPTATMPTIPYWAALVVFFVLGNRLFSTSNLSRWIWIAITVLLVIGFIGLELYGLMMQYALAACRRESREGCYPVNAHTFTR